MNNKIISLAVVLTVFGFIFLIPEVVSAAPLVPCGSTGQPAACNFCHFITLGNNILNWFFGFVFIIFGVMTFIAGFGLMTSGGNTSALEDAKKKLSNAFIGIIIVFSAWIIVDTLMKAAIPGGNVSGVGPWHELECTGGMNAPANNPNSNNNNTPPPPPTPTIIGTFTGVVSSAEYVTFTTNCYNSTGSNGSPGVLDYISYTPLTINCVVY